MSTTPGTVAAAIALARALQVERLDAQLLAAHVLARDRTWVLAHDDAVLDTASAARLRELLQRRAAGEPLAYLVGRREFHGLALEVTPVVLVPRPETELLVDWAIELLDGALSERPSPRLADLGTGSGAIALAVKQGCPRAEVHATDVSVAALDVAQRNGHRLGLAVHWRAGRWWQALPGERFDLVLSNPPYVAPGDPHLAALTHEPSAALTPEDDGGDGLADIERIAAGASAHLNAGGWLLIEHGADQGEAVRACLDRHGLSGTVTRPDLAGRPRVTGGSYRA